jgi:hypothetical protein
MARFEMGTVCVTRGVNNLIADNKEFAKFVHQCFKRFTCCDWGELCESDKRQNDDALKNNDNRLLAAYEHAEHPDWRLWIITEWDHSATTALFPSEY